MGTMWDEKVDDHYGRKVVFTRDCRMLVERFDPPGPNDPRIVKGKGRCKHLYGMRGNVRLTDCLFTLDEGERWIRRGGTDEIW